DLRVDGVGGWAALAWGDYRLEPAVGRTVPRPDGGARPAGRSGRRGHDDARLPGGMVVLGVGWPPTAALHGGRAFCAAVPRAADAPLRPAHLPDHPDHPPRPNPAVVLPLFPRTAAGVAGLG